MNAREETDPAVGERHLEDAEPGAGEAEQRRFEIDLAGHGERLDRLLARAAPEFSRSHLQGLVTAGHVLVDGQPCTHNARRLRSGQAVRVTLVPTAESQAFRPQPMPLSIVFEDEQILVVDKPAGLVVHPAAGNWSGTLLNGLLAHHGPASRLPRAGIVHRLDKDTSGLVVVGKTQEAVTALVRDIAARRVQREYLAIAWGELQPPVQRIEAPIGRDPVQRTRMAVVAGGKPARTDVEVRALRDGFSALRCRLHTGRTHQIRVHLAWRGHPLVADALYGGRPALGLQRQALHATRLAFEHPLSRRPMGFDCPPPPDFAAAWMWIVGT
ncbi:MAG TPA: RluA family pseudouridine synthase [Rubrivivax sp.]|nr:RluA family pseudouridine synthase [Burkholderiales bacterium]HNU10408.1 RluA family pseudouridine synthase [Rubrivivax sp.]